MVTKGVPVVLSWGLSVGDKAATLLTAKLYEELAKGISLEQAIYWARKSGRRYIQPMAVTPYFYRREPYRQTE